MKKLQLFILVMIGMVSIGLSSCNNISASSNDNGAVINQTVQEFKNSMKLKNATLVDIRTPEEYDDGHIEGSIMIDFSKKTFKNYVLNLPQNEPILIYCRSGNRTGKAASTLAALGFTKIYNLTNGIKDWMKEGEPIVKTDSEKNQSFQALAVKTTNDVDKVESEMKKRGMGIIHNLNPADFKAMMSNPEAILVDIRTPKEFQEGHIEGATMIDWENRTFKGLVEKLDKSKPTMIYCRSSNRSSKAASALQAMGFQNIYNLKSGLKGWSLSGLPVTKPDATTTEQ